VVELGSGRASTASAARQQSGADRAGTDRRETRDVTSGEGK
jgi:hypothetical protein